MAIKNSLITSAGFALVELMVVVTALALLTFASVNLFFSTTVGSTRENTIREIKQTGDYIISRLENDIRSAKGLDLNSDNPQVSCTQDMNSIGLIDWTTGETKRWYTNNKRLLVNGEYITNEGVELKDDLLEIDCSLDPGSNVSFIKISFTLVKGQADTDRQEEFAEVLFRTSVTMRNH